MGEENEKEEMIVGGRWWLAPPTSITIVNIEETPWAWGVSFFWLFGAKQVMTVAG